MTQQLTLLAGISDGPVALDWAQAMPIDVPVEDLETESQSDAAYGDVPGAGSKVKNYEAWRKELAAWIYRNHRLELFESPSLSIASNPGESERDFRVRLQQLAREHRDNAVEKLRQRYAPKIAKLEERKRRTEQVVGARSRTGEEPEIPDGHFFWCNFAFFVHGTQSGKPDDSWQSDHCGTRR